MDEELVARESDQPEPPSKEPPEPEPRRQDPPSGDPPVHEPPPDEPSASSEHYPFWGYADVVVFFGLALPCILLGAVVVKAFMLLFHLRVHNTALELVPAQFLG